MNRRLDAAAICTPGLEPFVEAELRDLGMKPKAGAHGVVSFRATTRQLYVANVWLRTASFALPANRVRHGGVLWRQGE